MKNRNSNALVGLVPLVLLLSPINGSAQVPVDDDGNVVGTFDDGAYQTYSTEPATGNEGIPLLTTTELEELVGPIALYPDDLLAVVLPASTYPLQVVQAARFLDDLESDPGLKPDPDWDDSIIALVNYPEVVDLLNEDLDWTWRLGEAVVAQQADVVNAVEDFRNRAYAAGNLKSDNYQNVTRDEGIIEITPVNEEIIYVPYYEPTRVVHYQPRPVYYYYPRPCPVYYYPYASNYAFNRGYFWGVTTAFRIGWASDHLRVFHHSYHGHPYYGRSYWNRYWYRRPSIHVHNNVYFNNRTNVSTNRYARGDNWRPSRSTRLRASDQRITRSVHYRDGQRSSTTTSYNRTNNRATNRATNGVANNSRTETTNRQRTSQRQREDVRRNSSNQSRQTVTALQRDRQAQVRDGDSTRQRQTTQRQNTQRQTAQQQTTQRRTTQRQTSQRQSSERRTVPSTSNRQRQQVAVVNQRRSEPVRQRSQRSTATTQRRTEPVQRQTQTTQRRAQPAQRQAQPAQRQSQRAERQSQSRESSSQGSQSRSKSSSRRSDSGRENKRRR